MSTENGMSKDVQALISRLDKLEQNKKQEDDRKEKDLVSSSIAPSTKSYGHMTNSDEAQAMRYFKVNHPKKLLEVNTCHPQFDHVPEHLKHLVLAFKEDVDVNRFAAQIKSGDQTQLDRLGQSDIQDYVTPFVKNYCDTNYYKDVVAPKLKAFGTGVANEGAEWVPTVVSNQFIEEYEIMGDIAPRFKSVPMPSKVYDLPVQTDVKTARIQTEGQTGFSQANFGTDNLRFTAIKFGEYTVLPEELNEDSAPGILAVARREVVQSQLRAIETALINGDNDGTHIDSDTLAAGADVAEKAYNGLRKLALANSAVVDFVNAAATINKLRDMRVAMDKFGVNVRELAWMVSPKVYNQMLALDAVSTVEKFGPQATILKGALDALDGIPILNSQFLRTDLNATGVYDGVTTDRAACLLVNHTRFLIGIRRAIRVRAMMDPVMPNDRWVMASWYRGDFQGHAQSATEKSVVYGYNIA